MKEAPGTEIRRRTSLAEQHQDAACEEGWHSTGELQKSWTKTFSRTLSDLIVRMGSTTQDQGPALRDDLLKKAKSVTIEESGDYRVRLRGPDGEIPVNVWDISKYPFWPYDHYQTLRKEWLQLKAKHGQPAPEDAFTLPHPGVDYLYNTCPYVMHIGSSALTSMSAHCILQDGSRLPADVDKAFKLPVFTEAPYTVTCGWFSTGGTVAEGPKVCC